MNKPGNHRGTRMAAILFASVLMLAVGVLLPIRVSGQPRQREPEPTKLAKGLIGTWSLAEAESPGNPSGIGSRLKFFTGTHWMITQPDPKTSKVIFHHGGRYTLEGDTMTETVDFANENTAALIGQSHKLKISVDGDTLKQTGLENPFTEAWKRAK